MTTNQFDLFMNFKIKLFHFVGRTHKFLRRNYSSLHHYCCSLSGRRRYCYLTPNYSQITLLFLLATSNGLVFSNWSIPLVFWKLSRVQKYLLRSSKQCTRIRLGNWLQSHVKHVLNWAKSNLIKVISINKTIKKNVQKVRLLDMEFFFFFLGKFLGYGILCEELNKMD